MREGREFRQGFQAYTQARFAVTDEIYFMPPSFANIFDMPSSPVSTHTRKTYADAFTRYHQYAYDISSRARHRIS